MKLTGLFVPLSLLPSARAVGKLIRFEVNGTALGADRPNAIATGYCPGSAAINIR